MSQPYSQDLRVRVLHALEAASRKREEIAHQFQISPATLYNWQKQKKQEGRTTAKPHAGGKRCQFDLPVLRALVAEQNDRTLEELATAYQQETAQTISRASVDRLLKKARITRKKKSHARH